MNCAYMANMRKSAIIPLLILLVSHLGYSRSIRENSNLISDGLDSGMARSSFLEYVGSIVTCELIYGFLPCSTNVWGLLFLIVVYGILLSIGGQFVANGSNLFFQIIGPGVFGEYTSLFQSLGMILQIVLVLVSALSGSTAAAQQRARLGMALVAGTTVMLLTLIWGLSVVEAMISKKLLLLLIIRKARKKSTRKGYGVIKDVETSYTARVTLITLVPFLIILLAEIFRSGRRVIFLIALIITIILLFAYMLYQTFQPWIQNRRFEYVMNKYTTDNLKRLISRNGRPDTQKIQQLYNEINKNKDSWVSAELRLWLLGVKMDNDDLSTDRDVENILASFDESVDGRINQDEFIKGMTKLASHISNQNSGGSNSQNTSQAQQGLLANSTSQTVSSSWSNYFQAAFLLTIGTVMLCALAEPSIRTVVDFAQAANLSSFCVSYLAIPIAMNYGVASQSITSARQKTQKSISLALSALYGGVYMNNIICLIVFLAPVYARDLSSDATAEVAVVLIICNFMCIFTSFCTTFPRWTGYLVILLYPISLAAVYVLTSVFRWS